MDGRAFLDSARLLMTISTEANRRSAVSRAYYAVLNEARSALERWVIPIPASSEAEVKDIGLAQFRTALNMDLLRIADCLDQLDQNRVKADNSLSEPGVFADDSEANRLLQLAEVGIELLDQIEADPARRANAIAAIRAAYLESTTVKSPLSTPEEGTT